MDLRIKEAKQFIRPYIQQISNEALWQLRAMAEDGKVKYCERCSCIRGIVGGGTKQGYALEISSAALNAEIGLDKIGLFFPSIIEQRDHLRNVRLLPIVKAEIRRRERLAKQNEVRELVEQEVNA